MSLKAYVHYPISWYYSPYVWAAARIGAGRWWLGVEVDLHPGRGFRGHRKRLRVIRIFLVWVHLAWHFDR